MKTPGWVTRNRALSHLRIATAVTLIFAAAAMAFFTARPSIVVAQSADAQAFPIPIALHPIPPKKGPTALAETAPPALRPPSHLMKNITPFLDYFVCGP